MREEVPAPRASMFVLARLPWLIGAGALVVYGLSLNHWVSLDSLGTVARTCGWLWQPALHQPLTFAVLYPFHFLPESWVPLALNVFNAVCAALVLVLLARSVAILPHDIPHFGPSTKEQPPSILSLRTAWLPPLLATVVCGLQLSFWEHATSATGEMIDLLVLAYVIRCLLEFRLDPALSWMPRAVCIYGAGMANNWAMVAFLPVFVAVILRLKGYGPFRERRFLLRMAFWGIAGLSLYLLLPTIHSLSPDGQVRFWTALKAHLKAQKEVLGYLRRPAFRVLAVTSLLPVLILSIRWKSHSVQFGDDTRLGVFLTKATVHVVHALFFFCALWIALDPTFSPRHLELGTPLLSYYYLWALVIGYCAGYFLLFGSHRAAEARGSGSGRGWKRIRTKLELGAPQLAKAVCIGLACALALVLAGRNVSEILKTNGSWLRSFAYQLYTDLPAGRSVVLSDSPTELFLLQAELSAHGYDKGALLLDSPSLVSTQYQAFMVRKFPARWPVPTPTKWVGGDGPGKVLKLVSAFDAREPVIQLQPSSGVLLESFSEQPKGSLYSLERRGANAAGQRPFISSISPPNPQTRAPTVADAAAEPGGELKDARGKPVAAVKVSGSRALADEPAGDDEHVWQERWTDFLQKMAEQTKEKPKYPPGMGRALRVALHLASKPNPTTSFIGAAYSKRLNYWGVQQQRRGRAQEAEQWFGRALALNPANLTAHINLEYTERCRRGDRTRLNVVSIENQYSELFAKHSDWRAILIANGPVDEPSFLFRTGRVLLAQGFLRQAIPVFARSAELAPDWPAPKLWLAQTYVQLRDFSSALEVTDRIQPQNLPPDGAGLSRLLDCRATALNGLGRTNEAARCLESFVNEHNKYSEILLVASEIYAQNQQFEAGLALLEELVKREPSRADLLCRKGLAQLQLSRFDAAVTTLTAALSLAPRSEIARLYRAVAYFGADQFEAARADYEELLRSTTQPGNALFGLGTIAWRQQDTNSAISYYQQYLSNGIPAQGQYALALERLKELQGGRAK